MNKLDEELHKIEMQKKQDESDLALVKNMPTSGLVTWLARIATQDKSAGDFAARHRFGQFVAVELDRRIPIKSRDKV